MKFSSSPGGSPLGSFTLTATPECNGTNPQIRLNWTVSSGATSYDVYRNGSLYSSGLTGTQFINASVTAGTTYTYYVQAKNSYGSTNSNTVSATAPSCAATTISARIDSYWPNNPSNPVQVQVGGTTTISVTFTNTGNTSWSFIAGASVWDANRAIVGDYSRTVTLGAGQQTTVSWSHAVNRAGDYWLQFSIWKDSQTLLDRKPNPSQLLIKGVTAPCSPPGSFTLSATPYWDTTPGYPHSIAVRLSWGSSSGATQGYEIYRNGTRIAAVSGTTFLNNPPPPELPAGSTHTYYVVAKNACGSTQSNIVSVTLTNVVATVRNTGGVGLNLRSSPGCLTTACKIANLPDGTSVTIISPPAGYTSPTYAPVSSTASGWWWYVSTPYGRGWVWGDYLY